MNPEDEIKPGYWSLAQTAIYLGVGESTLREWVRSKAMPVYQPSWKLMFKPNEVDQWMHERRAKRAKQRKKRTDGGAIGS